MKKNAEKVMQFVKGNQSSHLYLLSNRVNSTYIACNRPSQHQASTSRPILRFVETTFTKGSFLTNQLFFSLSFFSFCILRPLPSLLFSVNCVDIFLVALSVHDESRSNESCCSLNLSVSMISILSSIWRIKLFRLFPSI